nr:PREDICTED: inaD-like protein isoform X2 [Tribolium castaneum]|eukprot:XP_015837296.1 PREDICTED: inaD-like protein isoform X2 [Tribolium castaneum]
MVLNTEWAQVEVIDLINDGSGLAFGIIGGRSTGVVVKTILPGGVADRDGRLQSGDHILQIGEVNLRGLGSEQVASVLRQCGIHVRMVVARPVESTSADYQALGSHAPIVPTKILGDPVELDRHLIENGYAETSTHQPPSSFTTPYIYSSQNSNFQLHPITGAVDVVKNPLPIGDVPAPPPTTGPVITNMLPLDMALHEPNLPETETYSVELRKDDLGLGITVAGYVCEREEISGIFVKSISKGSAADLTKKIKINDRIVEVDGISVVGHTNHQAVELLRSTGPVVSIKFERYLRGPKYEQLQQAIKANELRPPSPVSPTISSLPKVPLSLVQMSYLGIEPEGESRTSFDFDSAVLSEGPDRDDEEIVIDGRRSLEFSIDSHESIYDKWKEKVRDDVEIVIAQMQKEPSSGLGISLEGTVDVEDGKEVRPHHYIRNILPDGPVGRNKVLQAGDELLEVNGIQLMGLNHLEVVSILKQLPNFVSLVCARYPVPIRIIDTSQHREAFQARKILAGSLQTLIPNNDRLVKAKSETSIASSFNSEQCNGSRSRSLELIAGLPMWSSEPTIVELIKGDHGLGFSILDYQDPLNPQETVIVIRSLVPGGVAQLDGRLIPGDRLLSVNNINVENATLDKAVQVLKGAPKGPVRIAVAKPLTATDAVSHASQDTEDDQTCLEDFQECIEEYQECLEVVHICIDEDNSSFNRSASTSQIEDLGQNLINAQKSLTKSDFLENNNLLKVKQKGSIGDSDLDISYKSTNDHLNNKIECDNKITPLKTVIDNNKALNKTDSLTQSDKGSNQDGYETCIDESFSDEAPRNNNQDPEEEPTPTNSKMNISAPCTDSEAVTVVTAASEPCLTEQYSNHIYLDTKSDGEPKSYEWLGEDEFFLVQYSPDEVSKSYGDLRPRKLTYRLKEYYNDYKDCLESYKIYTEDDKKTEMSDDLIFNEILLPFKSRSAPNIMDSSFVTLTYDPGPDRGRRKSDVPPGHQPDSDAPLPMTVIKPIDSETSALRGSQVEDMLQKHWGSTHTIKVYREPNASLGISIVGGKVDIQSNDASDKVLGIFVKQVVPDSPAGKLGLFKTGDRILEVSGVDLRHESHEKAVEAIRNAENPVTFVIQSLIPWNCENEDESYKSNENICPSPFPSPVSEKAPVAFNPPEITISHDDDHKEVNESENEKLEEKVDDGNDKESEKISVPLNEADVIIRDESLEDSEEDEEIDIRYMEGRTFSSKGQQIDRASAGNYRRSKEESEADAEEEDDFGYTTNKVKKKYASLGHTILMVQLERSSQGLGLSLAGHKDRNCMAVFVCGLNPNGAAYKTGGIQIGDEILEVNGVVLHGRCHLNASAIIKGLSGPIFKVIILRRKTAIDDIAVKPITQFPVSLAEEASEEQFSASYPNVRTVAIKKGNQSLGIMIIEGKHAEVGQGIFISDIQEGSSAEKAGLEIGEMILAVNKDSLVGSNYDTAANLLKRTEGLVNLVVSNPGKKDSAVTQANAVDNTKQNAVSKPTLKPSSGPPSRPSTPVPEPAVDLTTCPITPGKDVAIEIPTDNKGLGVFFVGGKDTAMPNGIVIVEVYPGGAADRDSRLQAGDQILEVNGTQLKDVTHTTAAQALRQTLPKMKLVVYRPERVDFTKLDVELTKKPGKGMGLSVIARKSGKGVYIGDIINGGTADVDGRIMKGDLLVSVNGQSVENSSRDEAGAILKTVTGRVSLKLHRYKPVAR